MLEKVPEEVADKILVSFKLTVVLTGVFVALYVRHCLLVCIRCCILSLPDLFILLARLWSENLRRRACTSSCQRVFPLTWRAASPLRSWTACTKSEP